jgi:heme/copper-type cytochrome/quinol oxidase subunit 2
MSDRSTPTVFENPIRLRRRARGFLIGAIVAWVVFLLVVLGSIAGSMMSARTTAEVNGAEIAGRIIALVLMVGVPTVLGVLLTVRSATLYKRAATVELREASSY